MQSQKPPRPVGVTIIAILAILVGAILGLAGVAVIALSALFANAGLVGALIASAGLIIAGVFFFFSLIWLLTGWGFLNGKGWAWILGLVFSILSILGAIAYLAAGYLGGLVGLVIWGLMIYYLMERRVKAFFGKGPAVSPTYANTPTTGGPSFSPGSFMTNPATSPTSYGSTSYSSRSSTGTRFCTNCGATISPGTIKCSSCGASV